MAVPHGLIEWRLPGWVILTSVIGRPDTAPEVHSQAILRRWIPWGATGWRRAGETDWHSLRTLPPEWGLGKPKHEVVEDTLGAPPPDDSYWEER